jgi:hypothetical protein
MSEPPWPLVELDPVKRRAAGSPKKAEEKEETPTKPKRQRVSFWACPTERSLDRAYGLLVKEITP